MPIRSNTYPKNQRSVITSLVKADKPWQESRVLTDNDSISLVEKDPQANAIVHYNPIVFNPDILERTLHCGQEHTAINEPTRHMTKHRVVTSQITINKTLSGKLINPFNLLVTSAVAPNFSGENLIDEAMYLVKSLIPVLSEDNSDPSLSFGRVQNSRTTNRVSNETTFPKSFPLSQLYLIY